MLFCIPVITSYHPAFASTPTGIVIPLYTYPTDGTWDQVISVKNAHPSVPIIAVINPNNGPSTSFDSNYLSGIQKMQSAGVIVLGYVHTGFGYGGLRPIPTLESEVSSYKTWYNPNGIFFDEMANVPGDESYYSTLNNYTKSLGFSYTMGNPGTTTIPSYIGTVDNICIFESSSLPTLSVLQSDTMGYPKNNFCFISYGVALPSQSFIASASQYVSYMYITDKGGSNPYNALPSYFGTLAADLDTGSVTTVPGAPTGLAASAVSSLQINLSWTAPTNNGGSTITGYKIDRSTDNGTIWSTIVSNTGTASTTYSDTVLASSTTYAYQVSAINGIGTSSPSSTASATTPSSAIAPQPPTSLTATATSFSQINLSWTTPANNGGAAITGYKIERSTDGGTTWSAISSNAGSTPTTYSDTGLAASTAYTYKVSAINSVGTSSPSNTSTATTSGVNPPPPPTNTVSLSVNSANLAGTSFAGMWVELHVSNGTSLSTGYTPITFTVTSGVQYIVYAANYQSTLFNHWNWSNDSTNSSLAITPTQNTALTAYYSVGSASTAPQPPTGLTTTVIFSSQINLSWTAPSNNGGSAITGYKIERSTNAGSTWSSIVSNTGSTAATYSDTGLGAGITYTYRVSAINVVGPSLPSNTVSTTTSNATSNIVLNRTQTTSGTVSSSYPIMLSNFNVGTGNNRVLVVGVSANNASVASVTFGGVPLRKAVSSFHNNDAELWYLVNPGGTGNIMVTMRGPTSSVVGAYSFSGVNQTSPIPTRSANHNTTPGSPHISITTKYANDWILDLPSIRGNVTLGSPTCAQQWDINISGIITGASSSKMMSFPATVACKWTANSGNLWDDVAIELKASR
jgi:hypothetical protein